MAAIAAGIGGAGMSDYFEIDFLDVGEKKSGDAIVVGYSTNGDAGIHVVDGGYTDTGDLVVDHLQKYYSGTSRIDRVIVTHPDGDHARGLSKVLDAFDVGELWMLRPWMYADELIDRFARFTSVDNLGKRLREIYPAVAELEELANQKGISIYEPFQGAAMGPFTVLAPSKTWDLDCIAQSKKTPESAAIEESALVAAFARGIGVVANLVRAAWGAEVFSNDETSPENEMSVVQTAVICDQTIMLTGDAGRAALAEAAGYAPHAGITLPGVDRFQIPHHGSRRNVSTEVLDAILGPRLSSQPSDGEELFTAVVSAAKSDDDHPRKAVVRAAVHRNSTAPAIARTSVRSFQNAPDRPGWGPITLLPYPSDQEE